MSDVAASRVHRLLAAVSVSAVLTAGCGAAERQRSGWTTYQDAHWGYSVRFPDSWHRAVEPVSPKLTEPREILSMATFPPRYRPTDCEAFGGSARSQMGREDVFLTVQERGYDRDSDWPDFPPRPERFGPTDPRPAEDGCGDRPGTTVHWRNFTAAGRHFHTLVAIVPDAPLCAREQAWRILDSLRPDPDRRPTWPASG